MNSRYWDEISDSELDDLSDADVFQSDALGGNGSGDDNCITDGPFANLTLYMENDGRTGNYCISRDLDVSNLEGSTQDEVDVCEAYDNYDDAWECYYSTPHAAGHSAVGGLMTSVSQSPGDPVFWLHHTFLDALWWKWQSADLSSRLTDMGGQNSPSQDECDFTGAECPGDDILDYDGDDGNTTTLDHVLWMMHIYENVTVSDVMNINSTYVCIDYTYPDDEAYRMKQRSLMRKWLPF